MKIIHRIYSTSSSISGKKRLQRSYNDLFWAYSAVDTPTILYIFTFSWEKCLCRSSKYL